MILSALMYPAECGQTDQKKQIDIIRLCCPITLLVLINAPIISVKSTSSEEIVTACPSSRCLLYFRIRTSQPPKTIKTKKKKKPKRPLLQARGKWVQRYVKFVTLLDKAPTMMTLGGSPMAVAVPPMLEKRICAISKRFGSRLSTSHNLQVMDQRQNTYRLSFKRDCILRTRQTTCRCWF